MGVSKERIDRYLDTIYAICVSPEVKQYRIGYTKRGVRARSDQYYATDWCHFVVLNDLMTRDDALRLEEILFEEKSKNKSTVLYRKYDRNIRDKSYRRSTGGIQDGQENEKIHGVYIAWTDVK